MRQDRFGRFGGRLLRARTTRVALAVVLIGVPVWRLAGVPGGKAVAPVDAPRSIAPLGTVAIPEPQNLGQFVRDKAAGVALGKALFWDMQVGSDGETACASCHFAAGADDRSKNALNPKVGPFVAHRPNYQLTDADFPFRRLADPADRNSDVQSDSDEVVGSAGLLPTVFRSVVPGSAVEQTTSPGTDPVFNVGGVNVRRVTGRNAPSVINAVFNFRNFWDGRAQNEFNGVDPFGARNSGAKVAQVAGDGGQLVSLTDDCTMVDGVPQVRGPLCLNNSSLASQAVGPPPNNVEMSADGRTMMDIGRKLAPFRDVGRKLGNLRPLGRQFVSPSDSVLGQYARGGGRQRGLSVSYQALVKKAFQPRWWDSKKLIVRVDPATGPALVRYPRRALASNEYPVTDYNFSLFFGLAIQMYEATLVSDQAPIDRFTAGDTGALTAQQQTGLDLFTGKAGCANCHGGPEFTNASVQNVVDQPLETMVMGDGGTATYDNGFYNVGVRPTASDLGVGANDPFGKPLSMTRLTGAAGRIAVDGAFKVPDLRNVALTPPYFHNGGQLTLDQVVDFYNRGGDFHEKNIDNLDPDIENLALTADEKDALVAFLNALTDERVRKQQAPFDHPQLYVPDGQRGDTNAVITDPGGAAADDFVQVPAVGAGGGAPLAPFPNERPAAAAPPLDTEPVASPAPAAVDLGSVARRSTTTTQIVIKSTGVLPLRLGAVTIGGPAARDFSVTSTTCRRGVSLPKDATCTITLRFRPGAAGPRAAELDIVDNAVESPLRIPLAGTSA